MICDVLWCHTTAEGAAMVWAALIGLAGGILALMGAIMVGRKQMEILLRQTDLQQAIANRAAEIEESKIRVDLFGKRFEVFKATQAFVDYVHKEGFLPGKNPGRGSQDSNNEAGITLAFFEAIETSKVLFRDGIHDDLQTIADAAESLAHHNEAAQEDGPSSESHRIAAHDLGVRFAWLSYNLTEIFYPDLQLGLRDGQPGQLNPDLTIV